MAITLITVGTTFMATKENYIPTLDCTTDGNSKGLVNVSAGLMTYDEVVLAGGKTGSGNLSYYLYKNASGGSNSSSWTMSPAGYFGNAYACSFI